MKKYVLFLGICLVSIFSFNSKVKAVNTTCGNVIAKNGEYHIILNNNDIAINSSTVGATKMTQIDLLLTVWPSTRWYIFEENSSGDVIVVLTNWWVNGSETSSRNNIKYLWNSSLDSYDFIVFEISNNSIISTTIKQKYAYYNLYSFSSSGGTAINSSTGGFSYGISNPVSNSYTFEESATCDYVPSTITAPTFEVNYTVQNEQNVAINLDVKFQDFNLEKYDYFISFDEGQTFENINSKLDDNGVHIITKMENFNVVAKQVEKETGNSESASYYEESIVSTDDYIIFYVDSAKNEYVTIGETEFLYSKTIRISPKFMIDNVSFRASFDGGEIYQGFDNVLEEKIYKNSPVVVEILDRYKNIIGYYYYSINGLESITSLGQKIVFDENCDNNKCEVNIRFINFNTNDWYWLQYGNSAFSRVYPQNWTSNFYKFPPTEELTTYCARITDSDKNIFLEECYTIKGFTTAQNFTSFMRQIRNFIDEQKNTVNVLSNTIDDLFRMIPTPIFNLLTFIYFLICLGAIIWNIRR